jgi:uncharacterized protein YtpQ (UPF0354 family)
VAATPSRDEFARQIMDRLARSGEQRPLSYDGHQDRLLVDRGTEASDTEEVRSAQYLSRWYQRFASAVTASEREAIIAQFVDYWFATGQRVVSGQAADISRLLPLVRSRFLHEVTRLQIAISNPDQAAEIESQLTYQVLGDRLAITIAENFPNSFRQITRNDLERLRMSFADALSAAKANLLRINTGSSDGIRFEFVNGQFWTPAGRYSGVGPSVLLFPHDIQRLPVQGQPVAFVPHGDTVWITGTGNIEALRLLSNLSIQNWREHPHPICALPFVLENGNWKPWLPDASHAAYAAIKNLHLHEASAHYSEQAALLKQKYQSEGVDLHLAEYRPMEIEEDDGRIDFVSMCVWTDTVTTLLPKTELVTVLRLLNREALDRGEARQPTFGQPICVPWERLAAHLGGKLKKENVYPERYWVDTKLRASSWTELTNQQHHHAKILLQALAEAHEAESAPLKSKAGLSSFPRVLRWAAVYFSVLIAVMIGLWIAMPRGQRPPRLPATLARQINVDLPPLPEPVPSQIVLPKLNWQQDELVTSTLAGSERLPAYRDIAPPGGWLVGLRVTQGSNWNGAIRAIEPIYQVGRNYQLGQRHGLPGGVSQTELLAREGYAIGAVTVRAGLVMNALKVEFQRVNGNRLDVNDAYESDWVGSEGGRLYEPLRSEGTPMVGISGSYVEDQFGLRVVLPPLTSTEDLEAERQAS